MIKDPKDIKELIKEAIYWEEEFLTKYDNEDIKLLIDQLPKKKAKKIKKLLKENISDTYRHAELTKNILKKLEGGLF